MLTPTPTMPPVLPVPVLPSIRMSLPEPLIPRQAPQAPLERECLPEEKRAAEEIAPSASYVAWLVGIQELLTELANRTDDLRRSTATADEYKQLSVMADELRWADGGNPDSPLADVGACVGDFVRIYEAATFPTMEELFPELLELEWEEDPELEATIAWLAEKNKDIHVPTEEEIAIDAFFSLGTLLTDIGKAENAIAAYDVAIRLKPDYAAAHCNRGSLYYALGDYTAALHDYDAAIRLKPERSEGYFNRAVTHFHLQHYTAAVRDYDAALARNPDDVDAYLGRAHANFAMQRYKVALQDYEETLRRMPGDAEVQRYRDIAQAQTQRG